MYDWMLKNEWPDEEALAALATSLGWDMTATIESTATADERKDPRNWQLTLNLAALCSSVVSTLCPLRTTTSGANELTNVFQLRRGLGHVSRTKGANLELCSTV